jgi:hypothetical protein
MPNSDTTYGTYNKQSYEIKILNSDNDSVITQSFGGDIDTAKNFFLTADTLTALDTNATQLQYAITGDGNGLKYTIAFGIKKDSSATEWAEAYKTSITNLTNASNFVKSSALQVDGQAANRKWTITSTNSHLF